VAVKRDRQDGAALVEIFIHTDIAVY
jgi:hypothetical protein